MPRLHRYRNRNACYVLTAIRGSVVTYQLTPDGDPSLTTHDQLELDFANDADPETAFPACEVCRSVNGLHLTLTGSAEDLVAQLQCAACRAIPAARPDTSFPVVLLSRPIVSRLFQLKSVTHKGSSVTQFDELLRMEFESKWDALRKKNRPTQTSLIDTPRKDELQL